MWTPADESRPAGPWLHSRGWDLGFIYLSGLLVALPLLTYYGVALLTGVKPQAFQHEQALGIAMFVNLGCAFFIGGPHMYATYLLTLGERRFREAHPILLRAAALIPPTVIVLATYRIEWLMTVFFAWASIHAAHQVAYLVQQYRLREPEAAAPSRLSLLIDYGLALSCLYPVATWRLLAPEGEVVSLPGGVELVAGFRIGAVDLARQLPEILHGQVWIAYVLWAAYAALLAAFGLRTVAELVTTRRLSPRTLLVLVTVPVGSSLFLFDNLDVALQGFNLWHSTQYIGLVYLMNRHRRDRGLTSSPFVASLSGAENAWRYYVFVVGLSVLAAGLIGVLHYGVGLPMLHVYYGVHLSALWIHYLWDHAVFTQWGALSPAPGFTLGAAAGAAGTSVR